MIISSSETDDAFEFLALEPSRTIRRTSFEMMRVWLRPTPASGVTGLMWALRPRIFQMKTGRS
jgi:hypothetical protein